MIPNSKKSYSATPSCYYLAIRYLEHHNTIHVFIYNIHETWRLDKQRNKPMFKVTMHEHI